MPKAGPQNIGVKAPLHTFADVEGGRGRGCIQQWVQML